MGLINRDELKSKTEADLKKIFSEYIVDTLSNYEKRKIIYNYVVNNFKYDNYLFEKYKYIFENNIRNGKHFASEVEDTMRNHKGISHNLSIYYKFLLEAAGIPAYYVTYHDENDFIYGLNLVYDGELPDPNAKRFLFNNVSYDDFSFDDVTLGIKNKNSKDFFAYDIRKAEKYGQGTVHIKSGYFWNIIDEPYFYIYIFENKRPKPKTKIVEYLISLRSNADTFLNNNRIAHDYQSNDKNKTKVRGR